MSTKIKLGAKPVHFAPTPVSFPMPDGTQGVITVAFKYRTRKEYGQFLDEVIAPVASGAPAPTAEPVESRVEGRVEGAYTQGVTSDARQLAGCVHSWDLTEDGAATIDICAQLADELAGATVAILTAYRQLVVQGRLGN